MSKIRIKPIELINSTTNTSEFHRSLSAFDLILFGVGAIVGAGIFVLPGITAAEYAGPGIILSFILSGFACACAAFMYAELSAMVPVSGSAYTYTYATMGEILAWIVGWNFILEYTVAAGAVSAGWSSYFSSMVASFAYPIPEILTKVPSQGGLMNLPAIVICFFATLTLALGTKQGARLNTFIVAVKIIVIVIFIALAVPHIKAANWDPFMPYGFEGVSAGAAILFFTYLGFDAVATASEETKNPKRDIPIGIIGSLIVCTILYIVVAAVLTGIINYKDLNTAEPIAFALRYLGYNFAATIIAVGAIIGITSPLLLAIYAQTRILYVMCRDGLLPRRLMKVHHKYKTPYVATWGTGVACMILGGLVPIREIAELANIGTLFAFIIVSISVLILRRTKPDHPRPFKCRYVYLVGIVSILSCAYLMINLPGLTWIRFILWTAFGVLIYALYGYRNSVLHQQKASN